MLKKLKYILGAFLLLAFLFTILYILFVRIADDPSIFGYSLMRMNTEDMEPEIDVGEIMILKHVEPSELVLGDVISYKDQSYLRKTTYVTHQISKEPYEKDGVYFFTTRGLKENMVDDPEIDETQVRGKVMYTIPLAGTLYDFFTSRSGFIAFILILLVIYGSDIFKLLSKLRRSDDYADDDRASEADIRQRESLEAIREQEFEGIITNLDESED